MRYILLIFIFYCTTSFASESPSLSTNSTKAKIHIKSMQEDGSINDVVDLLISDGVVCQIRNHIWENGCGIGGCLVIHGQPQRHCVICGKIKSRAIGAKWQGFNFAAIKGLVEIVDAQKAEIGSLTAALNNLRVINNLK